MSNLYTEHTDHEFNFARPAKVCLCKSVTKDQIIASINRGNHTIETIAADTLATTGCGTCKPQVQKILANALKLN